MKVAILSCGSAGLSAWVCWRRSIKRLVRRGKGCAAYIAAIKCAFIVIVVVVVIAAVRVVTVAVVVIVVIIVVAIVFVYFK